MIEHIFQDICTGCNTCVSACPTHVLEPAQGANTPIIARLDQCQTCFMCELYCEQDAIYVGADQRRAEPVDPESIRSSGLLGKLRRDYEWDAAQDDPAPLREFWQLGPLLMEGAETAAKRYAERHPEWAPPPPRR
jgi:NAD-dependent dihydropyrimidine dehydrogenase PreA subunit